MNIYRIEFSYGRGPDVVHGEIDVWAEDCRHALQIKEADLDIMRASVDAINEVEKPDGLTG